MGDELVSGLLRGPGLRVFLALAGGAGRKARDLAGLTPASASILAQGLASVSIFGALQKSDQRTNLQLECDGQLHGMFLDANAQGQVRGYVKNRRLAFTGEAGEFEWRPAFGNKGFVSVLRQIGDGEQYRSSIELTHFDLARDLEAFFRTSDQVESHFQLEVLPDGKEPLGVVAALLMQTLPGGDAAALATWGKKLREGGLLRRALELHGLVGAAAVVRELFPADAVEAQSRFPIEFTCSCSKDRVLRALMAMGTRELEDILKKEGQAEVTCEFCSTHYVIGGEDIRGLLAQTER